MSATNILPEKGIKATIDGVEYHFRFTTRIFAELADKYGSVIKAFGKLSEIDPNNFGVLDLENLAFIVHMALKKENPEMTFDYVYDEIDMSEISEMIVPIMEAFKVSMTAREKIDVKKKVAPVKK